MALLRSKRGRLWAAALGLALMLAALAQTPQCKAAARAAAFVPQVLPAIPVKPAEWLSDAPTRSRVEFPLPDGSMGQADLYMPAGGGRHSAVLLFLGVNPAGRDDERVVNLANSLARLGVASMAPWSERLTRRSVSPGEVDGLVAAFQYLRGLDRVDPDSVGMAGFCVGASLLLVAAQDERISGDVAAVNSFGGYYDAKDLMAAALSGRRFYGGEVMGWQPDPLSVNVTRTHLLEAIADGEMRERVAAAADGGGELPPGTPPDARAVYGLLRGPDLDEARRLLDALPPDAQERLRRISPIGGMANLKAPLLIMHDRNDSLVPSEESRRLVDAALAHNPDAAVHYTEFAFFDHVDPTRPVGKATFVRESFKLMAHMYRIMRALP